MKPWLKYSLCVGASYVLTATLAYFQVFPRTWGHQFFSILIATTYFLAQPLVRALNVTFPGQTMDYVAWVMLMVCHLIVMALLLIPLLFYFRTRRPKFLLVQLGVVGAYIAFAILVVAPWVKGW